MKDLSLNAPLTVTLRAGEWLWLLGWLSGAGPSGDDQICQQVYNQVQGAID